MLRAYARTSCRPTFAILLALIQVILTLSAAAPAPDLPDVRATHPRLGLMPDGTPGARTVSAVRRLFEEDATFQSYFAPALASAEQSLSGPGDSGRRRGGPNLYAACWVASGDDRFAEAAIDRMLNGEITVTARASYYSNVWQYALAYDWLCSHASMSAERKDEIEERIASVVAEELVELDGGYPAVWHGRNQLANNTLVAALALSRHSRRHELQQRAMIHFADAARALALTQGWPEGPSYWMYNRHFPYALAVDCFITATGRTKIAEVDLLDMIRETAYWHLYAMRPDGIMARFGDAYAQGPARTPLWQPVQDYYARITRDPGVTASADYFRSFNEEPYHRWRYAWSTVLTYDPSIAMPDDYDPAQPADYLNRHLPRARVFGRHTHGQAFFVERWGDLDATWIGFKAGDVFAHHGHYDQGNFVIHRGSPLAVHSGVYRDYFSPYRLGYFVQTVSANSILVDAPGEFSTWSRERGYFDEITGGQRLVMPTGADIASVNHWRRNQHTGVHYETGDILAFESQPDGFDYIAADITAAYDSTRFAEPGNRAKVSSVVRKLAYLRDPNAVLVLDRVVTVDPEFSTRWLLHTPAKPGTDGETLLSGLSVDDGVLHTDNRWLHTSFESGRLFHQVLLPENVDILKIGGPHHRHYVELSTGPTDLQPSRPVRDLPPEYGMWRTEVAGAPGQTEHVFLNVLWPRLAHEADPTKARLVAADAPAIAIAVADWIVVFRTEGEHDADLSYEAPPGTKRHLILDMWPRSAWRRTSHEESSVMYASEEGVLSFAAGAGPAQLTEVPPRDGPGHQ